MVPADQAFARAKDLEIMDLPEAPASPCCPVGGLLGGISKKHFFFFRQKTDPIPMLVHGMDAVRLGVGCF